MKANKQMIALGVATNLICDSETKSLESFYSDLKKLCEKK